MPATDTFALDSYRPVAQISDAHKIMLVQHRTSGLFYVQKELTVYNPEVYRYLYSHHIRGMPEIVEIAERDGRLIVIEEYISGETLRAVLDNGNLFSPGDAAALCEQVCEILLQLHGASPPILHRDIKPSNIILTPDGEIRLLDMNAAKQVRAGKTEDTDLIGTVGYAAPEQYGFGPSGVQTDIYSVGVLLCEMVTGSLPKYKMPGGRIGKVIKKCTRLDPEKRYKNVQELQHALQACRQPSRTGRSPSGFRRYLPPGFRSGSLANMLAAILGYSFIFSVSLSFTAKGITPGFMTNVERILLLSGWLLILLFTCNYLDVWNLFRVSRIRHPWLRAGAVLLFDVFFSFVLLFIMILAAVLLGAYK